MFVLKALIVHSKATTYKMTLLLFNISGEKVGLIGLFCGRAKITILTACKHVVCEMVCHLLELLNLQGVGQFLEELPQMGKATLREHT